ncbi:hypothetical protein ACFX13_033229 [Malus domestica]
MRSILDIKIPPKPALFDHRKATVKHRVHNPEPHRPQKHSKSRSRKHLSHRVVTQINPRIHSQQSQNPWKKNHRQLVLGVPEPNPLVSQEGEVCGEEEHVLRVTRRPPVRIAHLEYSAGFRPSLLEEILDELVDDLGDYKANEEEHALEFTAEEEVAEEAAEVDEYWDEGNPSEEVTQLVASLVLDVSQRHGFERRRNHGGGFCVLGSGLNPRLWELGIANGVSPDLGCEGKDFCDGLE